MKRDAKAIWKGDLRKGKGTLSTQSGALKELSYSFASRFENEKATNPEELLMAAHAGCFSMALSNELSTVNLIPERIETTARVSLTQIDGQWIIDDIHLSVLAQVPDAQLAPFLAAAHRAKVNCPVSRLFKAQISLDAQLETPLVSGPPEVVIYTSSYCQVCGETRQLLEENEISYKEIDLDCEAPEQTEALKKLTGRMSVPQVFVNNQFIGDYHDLLRLNESHGLERLLKEQDSVQKERKPA